MPVVDTEKEERVRRLLALRARQRGPKKLSFREIARLAGVARGTVQRIFQGRAVQRPRRDEDEPEDVSRLPFTPVAEYACPACTAVAGHRVYSTSRPCLGCLAREAHRNRPAEPSRGGHLARRSPRSC
jgi:predicted HTH domain antitoxin